MSIEIADVARKLGAKPSEILDFEEADAGLVVNMVDGTVMIDVPDDKPDADGKVGLMFLAAPLNAKGEYLGDFPVYAQPTDEPDAEVVSDEYPVDGSAEAVLAWVAGDQERAEYAADIEANGKKRKGLTDELDAILAQYEAQS